MLVYRLILRPILPPSTSPPAVKIMALFSFVLSLSVIVTVVATVAVSALPVTSPVISPTNAVDVILVAPVTTPASMIIVPSNKIAEPEAGSIFIAAPESKVNTPAELISTVPSAVIVKMSCQRQPCLLLLN